jgi:hypothetical protein
MRQPFLNVYIKMTYKCVWQRIQNTPIKRYLVFIGHLFLSLELSAYYLYQQ